jgi:ABC-type nitrate/sulfonate/bicarbonate transport system substrate-binding protein
MSERLRVIEFVPAAVQALAADLGYLDEGVEFVRTRSSTEQRERVMSDDCDVALTAIDNLIAWDADGDELRLVAQVERTTVLDLIAAPEIHSIAQLRGQALAVDAPDNGFAIVLRKVLADQGLSDGDYRLSSEGGIAQRFAALVDGRAAAGLLGPPWSYQAIEAGLVKLAGVHEALPALPGIGVAVRQARLEELDAPVTRYLAALGRAITWLASASREEALARLAAAGFEGRGAEDLLAVAPTTLAPSPEGLELLFDMRRELGLLPDGAPSAATLLAGLAIPPVPVT